MEITINGNVTINNEVGSTGVDINVSSKAKKVTPSTEERQPIDRTNEVLLSNDTCFAELMRILCESPEAKASAKAEAEEREREAREANLRQILGEDYDLVTEGVAAKQESGLARAKRRPGAVVLRNYEPCVARVEIGADSVCEVYGNGYAVYDNGDRKTVIWVPDCGSYAYYFGELRENEKHYMEQKNKISEDELGSLPWYHAIMLRGEDQIWANMDHPKSPGTASDKDEDNLDVKPAYHWSCGAHFDNPEEAYIRKEEAEERRRSLTDRQRKAYSLYYEEGYTQEEIGQILGINQKTVSKLLSKGIEKIKKISVEGA